MSSPHVTDVGLPAETLLRGVWFAAEQAGCLLHDACVLFDAGSEATATVIALFAQEEIGESKILIEFWRRALRGESVTAAAVGRPVTDHEEKQRAGSFGVSLYQPNDTVLGRAMASAVTGTETPDDRALVDAAAARKRARGPQDRHTLRMRTLYVDLSENGITWRRPRNEVTPMEAYRAVNAAADAYANLHGILTEPADLRPTFSDLREAVDTWHHRPPLPELSRPNRTPDDLK
jgi:AbiV family abortive infection protein